MQKGGVPAWAWILLGVFLTGGLCCCGGSLMFGWFGAAFGSAVEQEMEANTGVKVTWDFANEVPYENPLVDGPVMVIFMRIENQSERNYPVNPLNFNFSSGGIERPAASTVGLDGAIELLEIEPDGVHEGFLAFEFPRGSINFTDGRLIVEPWLFGGEIDVEYDQTLYSIADQVP